MKNTIQLAERTKVGLLAFTILLLFPILIKALFFGVRPLAVILAVPFTLIVWWITRPNQQESL